MLTSGQYLVLFPVKIAPSFLHVILGVGTPSATHSRTAEAFIRTAAV